MTILGKLVGRLFEVVIVGVNESDSSPGTVQTVLAKVLTRNSGKSGPIFTGEPVVVPGQLSEDEATRLLAMLAKFGIHCRIRPCIGDLSGLTLVPIDDQSDQIRTLVCPDCGGSVEFHTADPEPEYCPHCGLVFSKHDHQIKEQAICERVVRRLREGGDNQPAADPAGSFDLDAPNGAEPGEQK